MFFSIVHPWEESGDGTTVALLNSYEWIKRENICSARRKNADETNISFIPLMDEHGEALPSMVQVVVHFSLSIAELLCVLLIFALQIVRNISQACSFDLSVGFWSFPFLFVSPLSIWFAIWRRSPSICLLVLLLQLCSTLLATVIIVLSTFALLNPVACSTSSLTIYYVLALAVLFKVCSYLEMLLLYRLIEKIERTDMTLSSGVIFMWVGLSLKLLNKGIVGRNTRTAKTKENQRNENHLGEKEEEKGPPVPLEDRGVVRQEKRRKTGTDQIGVLVE